MLHTELPRRWSACQTRLLDALCEDPAVAQQVLTAAFGAGRLARKSYTQVAKYIADRHRDLVYSTIIRLPDELARPAVGTVCAVANHFIDTLTLEQRRAIAATLRRWRIIDPRHVWPAIIMASSADTVSLIEGARELQLLAAGPDPTGAGMTVIRSAFDTFLHVLTPAALVNLEAELRPLCAGSTPEDRNRAAELDGLITVGSAAARARVSGTIRHAAYQKIAFSAAKGVARALQHWPTADLGPAEMSWMFDLLESPDASVVRVIAKELDKHFARITPPRSASQLIGARLTRSLQKNDPQTAGALLDLLIELDRAGLGDQRLRAIVIQQLLTSVTERLPRDVPEARRRYLPTLFSLYKDAVVALGLAYYTPEHTSEAIAAILTGIDIGAISGTSRRTLAHLLTVAVHHDARVITQLEQLWPKVSAANKGAIAECMMIHENRSTGLRSLILARRPDCPPQLANEIHTKFD